MSAGSEHRLVVLGLRCPVPVLMAARAVADLAPGDRLEVLGDDPEMLRDFPAWCDQSGHRLLTLESTGKVIRCVVQKRDAEPPSAPASG